MKITSKKAREMLESYRGKTESDIWIDHCISVGDTAGKSQIYNGRKNNKFM